MNIFLSKDNKIIYPHLNHVLKSYYYTTNRSVYAYDGHGILIDKVTKDDYTDVNEYMDDIVKNIIIRYLHTVILSPRDSLIYELHKNIYTIIAPVLKDNTLMCFLIMEPFTIINLSTMDKKCYFEKFCTSMKTPITYPIFKKFEYIHNNRVNYLGQLFHHLMTKSIYIGNQHFQPKESMNNTIWGKALPLDCYDYTDGFINFPAVKQICDYLVIKDIEKALKTYDTLQIFLQLPNQSKCNIKMLKYQLVAFTTVIQYHLSNHFKDINTQLHKISNKCILHIDQYYDYSLLYQIGEMIIKEFFGIIKNHTLIQLSPNILQALKYINNNYMHNIKLSDIASSIPINESYLSAQFKQEYHISLKQYLNQYRINQATILIKNSDMNLTDIALKVGFESTNYFSTVFKKYLNMTPTEYYKNYTYSL
ncbi:hypothetical protein SH1V18_00170 [Vallitalea longa]|uniref:HTH araC/xylS-type domain-containing protein n=1 Tax=Vallitalea longa TaxID=2936439 RepID=A0A9W5Y7A4_9FIRM|nr:AraC family transcriptional regulator [Vallitalea longa]GKX27537.1 hypothetical protein SH1V18_00170 [Vallitalea longa]